MNLLEWRLGMHKAWADHEFIQDEDDIPGGCKVCWARLEAVEDD